jgi:hypothetical protein
MFKPPPLTVAGVCIPPCVSRTWLAPSTCLLTPTSTRHSARISCRDVVLCAEVTDQLPSSLSGAQGVPGDCTDRGAEEPGQEEGADQQAAGGGRPERGRLHHALLTGEVPLQTQLKASVGCCRDVLVMHDSRPATRASRCVRVMAVNLIVGNQTMNCSAHYADSAATSCWALDPTTLLCCRASCASGWPSRRCWWRWRRRRCCMRRIRRPASSSTMPPWPAD